MLSGLVSANGARAANGATAGSALSSPTTALLNRPTLFRRPQRSEVAKASGGMSP